MTHVTIHERSTMEALFEPFPTILEMGATTHHREELLAILKDEVIQPSYISRVRVESEEDEPDESPRQATQITLTCTFPLSLTFNVERMKGMGLMTLVSPCCSRRITYLGCEECSNKCSYPGTSVQLLPGREAVLQADGTFQDYSGYGEMGELLEKTFQKVIPHVDPLAVAMASMELHGIVLNILERYIKV